jgi:hypothetical protein
MKYVALPMFADVTNTPSSVTLNGVNHIVIGSARVS